MGLSAKSLVGETPVRVSVDLFESLLAAYPRRDFQIRLWDGSIWGGGKRWFSSTREHCVFWFFTSAQRVNLLPKIYGHGPVAMGSERKSLSLIVRVVQAVTRHMRPVSLATKQFCSNS